MADRTAFLKPSSHVGATPLAAKLLKRANALKAKREDVFDPQWQILSQYYLPELSNINTEKTENTENWFDQIYESTAIAASRTCSVGVRNWVTPSTESWLGMEPPNIIKQRAQEAMESPGAQRLARVLKPGQQAPDEAVDDATRWCQTTADEGSQALSQSNFYSVVQPFNRGSCVFGTGLMFCEEGKAETLRFEQFRVGTFVIAENDQKQVDTVFRWFKLTNRQAAQKFGEENLPERIREQLEKNPDAMETYVHCVYPNDDYDAQKMDTKENLPISSFYLSEKDKAIVEQSGYYEMPYFALRWSRWGTEDQAYGCSPAFETVAEARQLNYITQFGDALVELQAYPRFLYPDNLSGEVQLAAGGVTTVKADAMARGEIPKEWMTQGRVDSLEALKEEKRKIINEAFFVDIFTMLGQLQDKRMTATEVAQRVGEKLDQFTGTFDQYVTDLINPLVRRVLGILVRGGVVPPAPDSMYVQASEDPKAPKLLAAPKVNVTSRVTLAIKQLRNVGIGQTIEVLAPLAQQMPQIWDNFDVDALARELSRNNGVTERVLRSIKDMMAIRQQRTQQMNEQRALMAAESLGKAGAGLGKSPAFVQQQAQQAIEQQQPNQPQQA